MRSLQIISLFLVCLINIGWKGSENYQAQEEMKKAYTAWQAGNLSEALGYYEESLKLHPKNAVALNNIGVVYEEFGLPQKASEKYRAAIKVDRDYLPAYSNLGYLYWNQGDLKSATYYFEMRIKWGSPKDPWTIKAKSALKKIIATQEVDQLVEMKKEMDQQASQ